MRIATLAKSQSLIVIPLQHRKMYTRVARGASMCTDEGSGYYWWWRTKVYSTKKRGRAMCLQRVQSKISVHPAIAPRGFVWEGRVEAMRCGAAWGEV